MANLLQNPLYQAARAGKSVQPVSQPVAPPPQEPQAEPQSTAGYVGEQALNGLAAVGNVLDLPGSTARDVLTWLPGGTHAQNPFDQWLSPTSDKNRVTGRQYLRDYGLADKEDTWGNFLGGMAFEFLTDPLTPLEGFNALTRGGSALKAAGGSLKNVRNVTQKIVDAKAAAAGKVAPQVTKAGSAYRVTPRHYIESLPTKADLQKQFVDDLKKSAGEGFDPDNLSSTHKEMLKAHLEQTPNYDDAMHDYQTAYRTKYGKMSPDIESEIEASLDKPLKAFMSFRVPFTKTAPTIVGPGKEMRTFGQVDQSLDDLVAKQAELPGNEAGVPRNPGGEGPSPSGGPETGGGPSNSPAAPQSPSPSPSPAAASPVTADAFRQMLTQTATDPNEADALYRIYEARAASAGESLDDYVGKRIGSVEKIDAEGPKAGGSNARGSFEVKDGKAIIKAFKGQNLSTLAHETGHLFRQDLTGDLLAETEKYVGVKGGKWETHHEEKFARAWERYLRDGKAPTEGLKAVFENFKNWLTNIYVAIKGSPLATGVNKNISKVFDQLLTPAKQGDEAMSAVAPAAKSVADEGASLADDAVDAGRAVEAVGDSIPAEPVSEASSSVARESDVAKVADPVDVATEVAQPDQPSDSVSPVSANEGISSAGKQAEVGNTPEPPAPPRVDADRPASEGVGQNTPPVRTDFTNARTGQPAQAIAQALKAPESIMPEDLGMLLETVPESERSALSDALRQARPDLSGQVEDASAGLKSALNAMPEANPLVAAAKRGRGRPPRADVELPLPAEPTQHLPGTPERLEVMRQRVERGEAALHPDDAKAPAQATDPLLARSAPIEDVPANPLDELAGPSEEALKRMEGRVAPAKSLQEIAESSQRTADESSRLLDTLRKGAESIQPPVQKNDLLSIAQKALNAQINPAGPLSFAGKDLAGFRQQALKEMGVEVPAGQATESRLLNEYARQFGITGGSKSEIKASLRNAFEQHLAAGTKETPLQQSTKLIAEAAKAFESGDMDAVAKAINEAESILKNGDSVSPDVGPLHQSDAALPGEQPPPSIRAVVGAFKDQAQNWLKSLPQDKALMLADVFDGGGSLLSKLPTFRLAQSLFEPEVMSQVPVAGQRLGRLAYEANEMATMEHRQILEPIVKSFHDSGQFNDMALALKLGNDKGSIKRARDIINRRNGRLLEFLEGVREDLVTQEELNNPVLMHGVDLYSGLKDLEPQLALMRGVMDMQLVLDAAAGLRASKYQDKAGVLYFARQAVGPGKRSSNNPNVGRLLNTTAAHQLHRELRDIPGGTAFLDELSLDPKISAQYHSQPLMKKDIDSERFAAMRDYLMSRDDYAQKMFLDYDAFKADPDAYFKANPEEWTKLNGIISKVARLPTWYLDNNIPLFGWNLVHAFGRRVENGIRVRGMAKSLTTVLANAAYKTEKPGGFAIGQLMRDVGLRGNRAPMNIIEQMGVKDEYTKWHESNVKGILDRLDNDEVVNLDKTRSIKKDGDNYVISEKVADDSGEELAKGKKAKKGKKSKQAAEPKGDKLDTNEIEQTVVSREGLAQHIDDAYEFLDQQGYKVPVEMREIATKAMRPFSAPENIGMLRRIAEKFTTMFRSHVTGPFLPFHIRNALNSISNAVFYNAYDPTGNAATRYTKPWWQANELRSGKVIKNLGQEVPRFREAGMTDEQATQEIARLAFIHGVVGDKVGISSEFLSESVGKYASQYPGMNKEVQPLLGKFSPPPPGITKLDAINPFNLKGGARPEMSTEFPYFNLKEYDENGYLPARWGMDMASYVEDVNRLSKFTAFLKQGYSPKAAADEVRKIDVDYSHLTQWERKYARFLFPFYTYSSAVLPNTIEDLIQHPNGKQAWTIRVMNRARDKDNTTPDHIQGTAAIPLPSLADGTRQYITGLGLSLEDPMSFAGLLTGDFRDAGRELLSRMNPLVKAPVEVVTGQSLFQDGPFGGRALNNLDPPIGRTLANVKQLATGEKTEGQAEPFVSQGFEYAVSSSPFSRYATYARSITDPRKWENPLWQMANLTTGVRLAQVSPAQQDSTLAQRLAKQLQEMGARTATQTYIPEYRKERMSEEELKQAEAVQEFYREVQKRSRQRRKEEREAKELQLALEKQSQ